MVRMASKTGWIAWLWGPLKRFSIKDDWCLYPRLHDNASSHRVSQNHLTNHSKDPMTFEIWLGNVYCSFGSGVECSLNMFEYIQKVCVHMWSDVSRTLLADVLNATERLCILLGSRIHVPWIQRCVSVYLQTFCPLMIVSQVFVFILFQDLNYSNLESCSAFLRGSRSKTPSAGWRQTTWNWSLCSQRMLHSSSCTVTWQRGRKWPMWLCDIGCWSLQNGSQSHQKS